MNKLCAGAHHYIYLFNKLINFMNTYKDAIKLQIVFLNTLHTARKIFYLLTYFDDKTQRRHGSANCILDMDNIGYT